MVRLHTLVRARVALAHSDWWLVHPVKWNTKLFFVEKMKNSACMTIIAQIHELRSWWMSADLLVACFCSSIQAQFSCNTVSNWSFFLIVPTLCTHQPYLRSNFYWLNFPMFSNDFGKHCIIIIAMQSDPRYPLALAKQHVMPLYEDYLKTYVSCYVVFESMNPV